MLIFSFQRHRRSPVPLFIFSFCFFTNAFCEDPEIWINFSESKEVIDASSLRTAAEEQYGFLKETKFFKNIHNVRDPRWVRDEFRKDKSVSEIILEASDGQQIPCLFFDRNKKTVIVIGHGLASVKEVMALFTHIFQNHDLILMDFRGHSIPSRFELRPYSGHIKENFILILLVR